MVVDPVWARIRTWVFDIQGWYLAPNRPPDNFRAVDFKYLLGIQQARVVDSLPGKLHGHREVFKDYTSLFTSWNIHVCVGLWREGVWCRGPQAQGSSLTLGR